MKGDYKQKTVYNESPLEIAEAFEAHGFKRLHVVDLDGAKSSHIVNDKVLRAITAHTHLAVDFGGGIKSDSDIKRAFECGASYVTVGSLAVTDPERFLSWVRRYGSEKIILGADVSDGEICINGWKENSRQTLDAFLRFYTAKGIRHVLCTDISKDGMLKGPSLQLYRKIMSDYPDLRLIASGGISSVRDFDELQKAGVPSVVFGKAFYEGRIKWTELETYSKSNSYAGKENHTMS